jgi:hypothetical protein
MKLNQKIQVKKTKKLFMDIYQYKAVLVCPVSAWFRGCDLDFARQKLKAIDPNKLPLLSPPWSKLRSLADLDFCLTLESKLSNCQNFDIRVEHPLLNFYTNNFNDIVLLTSIDVDRTKYISVPDEFLYPKLEKNTVFLPKIDFEFKITMGKTRTSYDSFIKWADASDKVRLTKKCVQELSADRSWGGSYFYVKDEKSLTMVKMFLGSEISRIDRVINAIPAQTEQSP